MGNVNTHSCRCENRRHISPGGAAQRSELEQSKLDAIAEDIVNSDKQKSIRGREGKGRFVLIADIRRLEASKAPGQADIDSYNVQAPEF